MNIIEWFTRKEPKTEVKTKRRIKPKLIIDNESAFGKELKRQIGPRSDRLDGDFQQSLIKTATINNEIRTYADNLRSMSRTIAINTPLGKRAVQYQVDNVIGEGINPQVRILDGGERPNKDLNEEIMSQFEFWSKNAKRFSKNKRINWRRFQQLVERSRFIDGEVFIRVHEGDEFKLEVIEAARCKFGDREETQDGYILDGIEYDEDDSPIRYWFQEINKQTQTEGGNSYGVPADEIIHYYRELFPDQRRGIPEAVANIDTMNQYHQFAFATLVQKRAAASSMGFITQDKDGQENIDLNSDDTEDEYQSPEIIQEFEAGTIHQLPAGHDIKQFTSTQGGDDFISFTDRLEDHLAMGYGFYKQGWKGDTANINYSAARFGDQAQRVMFKSVQRDLKEQVFEVIFEKWIEWAILKDQISVKMTAIPLIMSQISWTYPTWESIDPIKDSQKDAIDVDNGFKSAADVIISRGEDPDIVFAQIEQERKRYIPKHYQAVEVAAAPAALAANAQVEAAEINSDSTTE
ncbi:TPA: phage portal protein [Escherichia coli]|nr:phage portal protein [Escherichia coli]HBZ8229050.1 phage portal protein [Escherichia coli]HBZ8345778.1 phage portal protein [Escherichia coli]HBZ8350847.1 phage portal protein [Escherichia coli]HBZ8356179.1 phage portal protein [Escherichia coli]